MSYYINKLSKAIVDALSPITAAQPSQVAGYWANREFWMREFHHLLDIIEDFDNRLVQMQRAESQYILTYGGPHNRDDVGHPRQQVRDTTNASSRRFAASEARTALKTLADRALDLHIASTEDYDDYLSKLKIANRHDSPT